MRARLILALAAAGLLAGCAPAPASTTPDIPSSGNPSPPGPSSGSVTLKAWPKDTPEFCPWARIEGILVRQAQSGAGLRDATGAIWEVIWSIDYTARFDAGRLVVLDGTGTVVAREGDRVELGGQPVGATTWWGCGGLRTLQQ